MSKMEIITAKESENKIYTVRSTQVRPEFIFQLTEDELLDWKSQTVMSDVDKWSVFFQNK